MKDKNIDLQKAGDTEENIDQQMSEDTDENIDLQKPENIRTVYRELCTSYRAIDDFRTKLLGFLPLATGGLLLLIAKPENLNTIGSLLMPIGIFGFAIALGLFFFELFGIKKCHYLIESGKHLESQMSDVKGQFVTRPHGILGFISEPLASGIIYPAVLAAWTFLAIYHLSREIACFAAIWVFTVGLLISCIFIIWLRFLDKPPGLSKQSATKEGSPG